MADGSVEGLSPLLFDFLMYSPSISRMQNSKTSASS